MSELATPPADAEDLDDVMSNFDHDIDEAVAAKLVTGNYVAGYPAWDFHGTVWFQDGVFKCQVKRYLAHVATIEAPTLRELMSECCRRYGAD